jgi:hypothetical protein
VALKAIGHIPSQPSPEDGGWVVRLLALADALDHELADPGELEALADRLVLIAERLGAGLVTGASAGGDQMAGAMAVRSRGRVRLLDGSPTHDAVLVVDTLMATGTQVIARARQLRETGFARVVGAVLLADAAALEVAHAELGDEVVALEMIQALPIR